MNLIGTTLDGVALIKPKRHIDNRGYFSEIFNSRAFSKAHGTVPTFVQDNLSLTVAPGTIRGLHFQSPPMAQVKLIMVVSGAILDVAVDIRHGSPTFGQHVVVGLSAEEGNQLIVPQGFAHGFCTLVPNTVIMYKVTEYYSPAHDKGIIWNDPDIAVPWPEDNVILSEKDRALPALRDLPEYFTFSSSS